MEWLHDIVTQYTYTAHLNKLMIRECTLLLRDVYTGKSSVPDTIPGRI